MINTVLAIIGIVIVILLILPLIILVWAIVVGFTKESIDKWRTINKHRRRDE